MAAHRKDYHGFRTGSLVAIRELPDGSWHCVCDCGRYRTVQRARLTSKDVRSCHYCAALAKKQQRPYEIKPIEPVLAKVELPPCKGCTWRMIDQQRLFAAQPDCPRHGIGGINLGWPPRVAREVIVGWE